MSFKVVEPVDKSWTILDLATKRCPPTWEEAFAYARDELVDISARIQQKEQAGERVFPNNKEDIFRCFELCPLYSLKVIIFGQDPYPQEFGKGSLARGLCFSVPRTAMIP